MTTFAATGTLARDLRATVRGAVIAAGEPGYDEGRAAHVLNVDQRPAAVVVPKDAVDVAAAVRAAAAAGLRVTAQAGGHGAHLLDGGLRPAPDPRAARRRARRPRRVRPRGRRRPLGRAARRHRPARAARRLPGARPASASPATASAAASAGSRAPSARAPAPSSPLEVVDGDGVRARVTADRDPEAFWALRGGSGSLGIVTALEVRLHRAPAIFGGLLTWSGEHARDVLGAWRRWVDTVGEEVTSMATVMQVPPLPALPPELRGRCVVRVGVAILGDEAPRPRRRRPAARRGAGAGRRAAPDRHRRARDARPGAAHAPADPARRDAPLRHRRRDARPPRGPRRPRLRDATEPSCSCATSAARSPGSPETPAVFGAVPEPFLAYAARRAAGRRRSTPGRSTARCREIRTAVAPTSTERCPLTFLSGGQDPAPRVPAPATPRGWRRSRSGSTPPTSSWATTACPRWPASRRRRAPAVAGRSPRPKATRTQRGPRRHGALSSHHDWTCTDGPY